MNRNEVVQYVRKFGDANSDAVLDPHCRLFSVPEIQGVIGYRMEAGCAVVFGDPACSKEDRSGLVRAFHQYCEEQGKNVVYVVVSEEFKDWALNNDCQATIEFGQELYVDPTDNPRKGPKGALARRKVRRAKKSGVQVEEYFGGDSDLEAEMEKLADQWLESRKGLQIYISHVHLFECRMGKRWFYATQDGKVIGVVVLNELKSRGGWLLNHLMVAPDASGGTPEILVITALDTLAEENCHYVTFGGSPCSEIGEVGGFGIVTTWLVPRLYSISRTLLKLKGKQKFWDKFQPRMGKSYLLFRKSKLGINELMGLKEALNISLY